VDKHIIDACILYDDALRENQSEIIVPLEKCRIFYVPTMPHSHRTVWAQSDLLIFYCDDPNELAGDYLKASDTKDGVRRGVYFIVTQNDDYDHLIIDMASGNLQQTFSRSFRPKYVEINYQYLLKIPQLLSFA
jgi:hypothetical protein